jgi:coenzyme F420-reducing hydrogenase beta subunit
MIKIDDKALCSGCRACEQACPLNCIDIKSDNEGFLYPEVDTEKCINCGLCEKICPILNKITPRYPMGAYGCINKNDTVREQSSSGGIFYLLGEYVVSQNGVVFGAKFDDNLGVIHDFAETVEGIRAFQGSKYLQSDIGDTYKKAKDFLEQNRLVLFTGTPCEIGGLRAYLQKDYPNLICQDIICHGSPSPKVWQRYIEFREKNANSKIVSVSLRHKKHGWKTFSVRFKFQNCDEYISDLNHDLYMRSFLSDLTLRPSCYNCSFKGCSRNADITLADFWGVESLYPDIFDDKGTSLAIVNSDNGEKILHAIKEKIILKPVDFEKSICFNSAYSKSVLKPNSRDAFMKEIFDSSFDKVTTKYCKAGISTKIKSRIKRLIKIVRK